MRYKGFSKLSVARSALESQGLVESVMRRCQGGAHGHRTLWEAAGGTIERGHRRRVVSPPDQGRVAITDLK